MTARSVVLVSTPYCPDSFGEQVILLPFMHFLREAHPNDEILGVVPEASGAVLEALGVFDASYGYTHRGRLPELARVVRSLRGRNIRIVYQLRRKSLRATLLARLSTAAPMHGFQHGINELLQVRSVAFDTSRYIAESYAGILGRTTQEYADATALPREGSAVIIPAGRTEIKRYPLEKYVEVARALAVTFPVRFLLGPDMEAERGWLETHSPSTPVDFACPIPEVARIVRSAKLVIANDCGPAHLAHGADVPRVILFDSSINANHWFFPGRRGRIVRSPGMGRIAEIPVAEILRAAREVASGECSRHGVVSS